MLTGTAVPLGKDLARNKLPTNMCCVRMRHVLRSNLTGPVLCRDSPFESVECKPLIFKLGLLSFWSLWHGIVLLTNLFEGLKVLHVLPARWRFASTNYDAIVRATQKYHPAPWIPRLLFSGVLLWQVFILVGFGWAMVASVGSGSMDLNLANIAFGLSLSLLAAFIIADELCTEYDTEHGHILFFIAQLLTVIALAVLPH